jgi:hypothetical protein
MHRRIQIVTHNLHGADFGNESTRTIVPTTLPAEAECSNRQKVRSVRGVAIIEGYSYECMLDLTDVLAIPFGEAAVFGQIGAMNSLQEE